MLLFLFGGFTAILGALISIDAIPLVWYRMLMAVVFIFSYLILKKKKFKIEVKTVVKFFISGIIIAVHWVMFFKAIKVSNVSVASVTMSTGAFFASMIEPFFFKKRIQPIEILLGLLAILGLYIIFNFESMYTLGVIYALISAFSSALFLVLNGIYVKKYDAAIISFYQLLFGTLGITIFLWLTHQFSSTFFILSYSDWLYLLLLSSICTAYAFINSVEVMKYVTPYTVVLTINLEPVYAIILALFIFGEKEQMNAEFYYGALIVLLVVVVNSVIKNKDNKKKRAL